MLTVFYLSADIAFSNSFLNYLNYFNEIISFAYLFYNFINSLMSMRHLLVIHLNYFIRVFMRYID